MRFTVWLVVVWIALSHHPSVAAAEGAPPETVPDIAATNGHSIVPQIQRDRLVTREVVTARVYRSSDLDGDALRAALEVAQTVFVAILVRFLNSQGRHLDTRCLGEALIDMQNRTGVMATVYIDRVLHSIHRARSHAAASFCW